jgi:hypothetical protein
MSKTKHLDAAIAILRGTPAVKRAKRPTHIVDAHMASLNTYTVHINGRLVHTGDGDLTAAHAEALRRAAKVQAITGKAASVHVYAD